VSRLVSAKPASVIPGCAEGAAVGLHNGRSGRCFPSYEAIAAMAECERTVAATLKALEWADVLTWQNRITRIRGRCRDLFGRESWRWRVIRTSNAYVFNDPLQRPETCRLLSRNIRLEDLIKKKSLYLIITSQSGCA
jgi:hypothetical protein